MGIYELITKNKMLCIEFETNALKKFFKKMYGLEGATSFPASIKYALSSSSFGNVSS